MRIFALVIFLLASAAFAGPDGLYFAQERRIEKGQFRTVETLVRVPIGGVGLLPGILQRQTRGPSAAVWRYDPALKDWVLAEQVGHFFAPKRAKELYQRAVEVGLSEFFLPVAYSEARSSRGVQYYYDQGIRQVLAEATTYFGGSSNERRFNIGLGASRLSGVVVAPGQTFSFAKSMGEVSERTGFKKAWVISGEQTVEGVGGGMCQVSTTLFRAAYFSGLPIVQRRPHSYQVRYYLPTGLDAAVFLPYLDLKFKNDTPGNIMIQSFVGRNSVTFRVFGTKDRSVSWTNPVTLRRTPPPPTRFVVSDQLGRQRFSQVDFAAEGATVQVNRTIRFTDGRVARDALTSTYRPWGAVWLVGEGTRLRSGRVITRATDDAPDGHNYQLPTQTASR